MIPVAVVLIVLVIVFTIAIIIGNPQSFDLLVFVARIPANITGVYVTGAVTMLVLAVAGWLLWTGLVRMRAKQKEIRDLKVAAGARTKSLPSGGTAKGGKAPKSDPAAAKKSDSEARGAGTAGEREPVSDPAAKGDAHSAKDSSVERSGRSEDSEDVAGGARTPTSSTGSDGPGNSDIAGRAADPSPGADHGEHRKSSRDRHDDQPSTTPEERRRLLDEADELARDADDK